MTVRVAAETFYIQLTGAQNRTDGSNCPSGLRAMHGWGERLHRDPAVSANKSRHHVTSSFLRLIGDNNLHCRRVQNLKADCNDSNQ